MKYSFSLMIALLCCTTALAQPAPAQQQWGTILGRIVYDGKPPIPKALQPGPRPPAPPIVDESLVVGANGGFADVFVYLRSKPRKIHPGYINVPPQKQTLTSRNFRFEPHALAMWTNDDFELVNAMPGRGENVTFNSNQQGFSTLLNPRQAQTKNFRMGENLPKPVVSSINPWMSAQLLVRDNPYFCITNERGIFCIPNLPTNETHEFVFWHERCGYINGMANQAPNPAHNIVLDQRGRLQVTPTESVLDLGEFLADPKKFK